MIWGQIRVRFQVNKIDVVPVAPKTPITRRSLGVELEGFEPSTPCMPCKCSAELSYSPREMGSVAGRAATPRRILNPVPAVAQTIDGPLAPVRLKAILNFPVSKNLKIPRSGKPCPRALRKWPVPPVTAR